MHQFSHPTSHQKNLWCSWIPLIRLKADNFFKAPANASTGHEYPSNLDKRQGIQFENLKLLAKNQ